MYSSFSQRIILSCIFPLILIAGLYTAYMFYSSNKTVSSNMHSIGTVISASLMDSGAQALISRQQDFISRQAVVSILNREDISAIEWLTLERKRFVITTDNQFKEISNYTILEYPIYYTPITNIDTFEKDLQLDEPDAQEPSESMLTGYVKIYFDKQYLLNETHNVLLVELGAILFILLFTIIGATLNACRLSGALKHVFTFINRLDQGDYSGVLKEQGRDELEALSCSLNQLAATLTQNQKDIKDEKQRLNSAIVEQTKQRNEADKANDWLKQMLGVLSHEMRTPLNAVVAPIDMVINKSDNPFIIRRLENALSHIDDMLAQLDNLMDYTQLEYGDYTLNTSPTNVRDIIERVVSNYQLMAEKKGLELVVHYTGDPLAIDSYYNMDGQRLTQILINLISNAIKFSHSGTISVNWSLISLLYNTVLVNIDVTDQGIGISPDISKNIFEMFHQADSDISRRYGGLGIGLGLCKKYADLMNGQLTMSSQKNQGSTFTVTFSVEKILIPVNKDSLTTIQHYHFEKQMNVLIIEDNIENCNVLCQLLKRIAPNIVLKTECDGKVSLERIRAKEINADIVLVDVHLPNVSGLEIIQSIREKYPSIKVVAVTADTSYTNQDACFNAGAELFIKKPVRLVDIAQVFEQFENENF